MKREYKRWTEQEDDRVEEVLNDDSLNISEAFKQLSSELGRTEKAINFRWYGVLNNPKHKKYRGSTCFVTVCRKRSLVNGKVLAKNSLHRPIKTKVSVWRKIIDSFKRMMMKK